MGKLGDSHVFASESCALDIVGATAIREVERGEIVAVDRDGVRSSHPLPAREGRQCVFEYVYFARPDSQVFGGSVDRKRQDRVDAEFVDVMRHAAWLVFRLDGLTHLTSAFDDRGDLVCAMAWFAAGQDR